MRIYSAHSLRSLLITRVVMGFGGGAFLVRAVILGLLMFPGKDRIFAISRLYPEWPAYFRMLGKPPKPPALTSDRWPQVSTG